jgi:hypothetical protein
MDEFSSLENGYGVIISISEFGGSNDCLPEREDRKCDLFFCL